MTGGGHAPPSPALPCKLPQKTGARNTSTTPTHASRQNKHVMSRQECPAVSTTGAQGTRNAGRNARRAGSWLAPQPKNWRNHTTNLQDACERDCPPKQQVHSRKQATTNTRQVLYARVMAGGYQSRVGKRGRGKEAWCMICQGG